MIVILYVLAFLVSFFIVYLLIPPLGKLAFRLDFVDRPREDVERKIHREPIPLTASYAIFVGFFITYLLFARDFSLETLALFIGGVLLLTIGTIDDWYKTKGKDFPALPKFIVQIAAAILVFSQAMPSRDSSIPSQEIISHCRSFCSSC